MTGQDAKNLKMLLIAERISYPSMCPRFGVSGREPAMPTISTSQLPPPSCWEEFELISADLLSKEWNDPNVQANGRRGQRQNDVDIRGRNGGTPAGAQCKGKRK